MTLEGRPEYIPEKSRLVRALDAITGVTPAKKAILAVVDEAHEKGISEITDREIKRQIQNRPSSLRIFNSGINRALDYMQADGTLLGRRLSAEEAIKENSNYGNNYKRA